MRAIAFVLVVSLGFMAQAADANPFRSWKTSCSVDSGSITKKGRSYTFKTSTNRCSGGTYTQRAEIKTDNLRPNVKAAYLLETNIAMTSNSTEKFDIFQIHDGRDGCAPPLKVQVAPNGTIRLQSAVKLGPGEQCLPQTRTTGSNRVRVKRDGTVHNLQILIAFDGKGGFESTVWLDEQLAVNGSYVRPDTPGAFISKYFYFKHGVYSLNMFDYVMTSEGLRVKKVRVKNEP